MLAIAEALDVGYEQAFVLADGEKIGMYENVNGEEMCDE